MADGPSEAAPQEWGSPAPQRIGVLWRAVTLSRGPSLTLRFLLENEALSSKQCFAEEEAPRPALVFRQSEQLSSPLSCKLEF